MTNTKTMDGATWALLLILSLLWGGAFFFGKIAVSQIPPLTLTFLRVATAACILHAFLRAMGHRFPLDHPTLISFAVMGCLNNVAPFSLIFWGQTQISSSLASVLNATTPFLTIIVAALFLKDERPSAAKTVGVLLGLCGVAIMLSVNVNVGTGTYLTAEIACLGAALSYACAAVYGRRFAGLPPVIIAAGQLSASSLIMAPIALYQISRGEIANVSLNVWGSVLALGAASTALAYLLFFRILQRAGATNVAIVTLLIPVSAIFLGAIFLGEKLALHQWIGLAVIFVGLIVIDGRLIRQAMVITRGRAQ